MQTPPTLITRPDALARHTAAQIRHRLKRGDWQQVFRGVYAISSEHLSPADRIAAAMISAGPGLVAAENSAAELHACGILEEEITLYGSPRRKYRSQPQLRIQAASLDAVDITERAGLPCTTADRAVVDLARTRRRIDALPVIDAALRAGICTRRSLVLEVLWHHGLRGVVQARELIELGDGLAESPMESRLRLVVIDGELPTPVLQFPVGPFRFDLAWPQFRVAAEYDGIVHLDRDRQRRDLYRRNLLLGQGWTVLSFTDTDVYQTPARTVAMIRHTLGSAPSR
ncbi:MAG TPA: DUF559 domain-containing protein [Mycobacteriales bacterium]|nr:DUF559 domain-containing protein [Mycobacteriales bacterium]